MTMVGSIDDDQIGSWPSHLMNLRRVIWCRPGNQSLEKSKYMKNPIRVVLWATIFGTLPVFAGDVGVSVTIGQPGFYGRIDIGQTLRPTLIYSRPVLIQPSVLVSEAPPPLYIHVPPGYEKHWEKHCREYNACGVPVYFVQDAWYNTVYVDHYRKHGHHRDDEDNGHENRKHLEDHGKGHKHDGDDNQN